MAETTTKVCKEPGCHGDPSCAACSLCAARHCRCTDVAEPAGAEGGLPAILGRSGAQVEAALAVRTRRLGELRRLLVDWHVATEIAAALNAHPEGLAKARAAYEGAAARVCALEKRPEAWWWLASESYTARDLLRGVGP